MEIRLSSSNGAWTCRISLRWEYDEHRKPLTQHKEVPFGDPFSDKSQLELMLRRAQTAVLNQNYDPSYFLDKEGETLKLLAKGAKQSFSRNVVCVDINGPGLPDLSFIDLPGTSTSTASSTAGKAQRVSQESYSTTTGRARSSSSRTSLDSISKTTIPSSWSWPL